ncbi:stress-response A/B barrel domain-containing protein DABB1 [Physcomitrium patens]|uniref:Stress-response A/B barrel domain-containing protein n=1 Tax=Physcomitrium patens TaxID=3218 RepID=A0A2K1JCA6_PHYPA|nr:stress-response A/B barrel domain-containing protein DABB1-like [Physcomitrium patens]PNR39162.1 hypothetical protein PHYPA_019440 [Physcomitrium patens]|eukprot:XP_024396642.1 stress-response A/B barrel domain-containing protein DABB1-like [Physcomitrella patens]
MGEPVREPSIVSVEPRMRRPSSIAEASLRGRRVSVVAAEKASLSRRQSHAAFLSMAPGFTEYVVEHVVLFKVKDDADPAEKKAMLDALHELRSLNGVLELTVGSALSVQGGKYTHVLHGRYKDKAALKVYLVHPDHVNIQQKYIQPLTEDIIALDWECIPCGPYIKSVGAKRITFVKIKPETTADDMRFLVESISQLPSKCPTVGQASAGSNFSPERAKGFTYGIMEFFPSTQEEEEVYSSCEHMAWQDTKLKPVAAILIHADLHVGE